MHVSGCGGRWWTGGLYGGRSSLMRCRFFGTFCGCGCTWGRGSRSSACAIGCCRRLSLWNGCRLGYARSSSFHGLCHSLTPRSGPLTDLSHSAGCVCSKRTVGQKCHDCCVLEDAERDVSLNVFAQYTGAALCNEVKRQRHRLDRVLVEQCGLSDTNIHARAPR